MVSTHELLFSLIMRVVWFHIFVNLCAVCCVLCVTRYGYCSALTFSSESSFIGILSAKCVQKLTLACTFAFSAIPNESGPACAVIRPFGIVAKGMGTAIVNPFGTLIDVWRQQKKQQAKKTNIWSNGSAGIASNHLLFFLISSILNQMYSYVGSL